MYGVAISPTKRGRMNEQEEVNPVATEVSLKSSIRADDVPTGPKLLSSLNAIAWSAGIAVLTGFATFAGMARERGKSSALGLYSLSRVAIDQQETYRGMTTIIDAALIALFVFVAARFVYGLALWVARKTPFRESIRLPWLTRSHRLRWVALFLVFADAAFLNANVVRLAKQADGIILKHTSDVGTIWTGILLDEDKDVAWGYELLYGSGLAFFVVASWWLISTKFKRPWSRIAFSLWAGGEVLSLLLGYSFLSGVTDTIDEFPVVAFSGSQDLQPGALSVLLGSDDK
jgi:hypothetical protein